MPVDKPESLSSAFIGAPYKAIFSSAWNKITGGDVEPITVDKYWTRYYGCH